MNETIVKATVVASLTAIFAYFQSLIVPLIIVVSAMLLDFGTGIAGAWVHRELSSDIGRRGIIKKVAQISLIAVGAIVDMALHFAGDSIGMDVYDYMIVCVLIIFWITANECISIMENYSKITGKEAPGFLVKIIDHLKKVAEKKGNDNIDSK